MFLRPFGSKRLHESYVFKLLLCLYMLICYYVFKKTLCLLKKLPSTLGSEKGSYYIFNFIIF